MAANRSPNLRLRPELADVLAAACERFRLPRAVLVGILVHNDSIAPAKLVAGAEGKLSRVFVPCSLRPPMLALACAGALRSGLSRNAYLEALIAQLAHANALPVLSLPASPGRSPANTRSKA